VQKASERVGGVSVQLSHLDKTFFPCDGISKGDLIEYYREMAPRIIPYLRSRPLVMVRYPDGITGQRIVQKNISKHFPGWISRELGLTTYVKTTGGKGVHVHVPLRPED